jgi:acyl carrier protein
MRASRRRVGVELRRFLLEEIFEGRPEQGDPFATGLIDSLALEQLAAFVEDRFGAELVDEDLSAGRIGSVDAFADLVFARAAAASRR